MRAIAFALSLRIHPGRVPPVAQSRVGVTPRRSRLGECAGNGPGNRAAGAVGLREPGGAEFSIRSHELPLRRMAPAEVDEELCCESTETAGSSKEADPERRALGRPQHVRRADVRRPTQSISQGVRLGREQEADGDSIAREGCKRPVRWITELAIAPARCRGPAGDLRTARARSSETSLNSAGTDVPSGPLLESHRRECVRTGGHHGRS